MLPILAKCWALCLALHVNVAFSIIPTWSDVDALAVLSSIGLDHQRQQSRQPNIILILADDQDLRLESPSYMPLLNKHIVQEGLTFDNHFTTKSICCLARAALWTGRQPHNTNVTDVDPPYGGFPKFIQQDLNDNYLPVWLQQAGYNTYYTGKLFNSHSVDNYNDPEHAGGWSGSEFLLDPGTYSYLNPIYQRNHDEPVQYHGIHTSDLLSQKTLQLLREAIDQTDEKPFFQVVAPIAPHSNLDKNADAVPLMTELIPCSRHSDLFSDVQIPRTPNFNPPDTPDTLSSSKGASWLGSLPYLNESSVAYLDHFYRQRLRALQAVDELVDELVQELEQHEGLLDNTYIIYTSDNGFYLGQHRLPPGKECGIEEDVRVPSYVRGPGLPKGSTAMVAGPGGGVHWEEAGHYTS